MTSSQVEYVGFRNNDRSRDYLLCVRHPDGRSEDFVISIAQAAFVAGRLRYQDGAEISFLKLSRAVAAWATTPQSEPLAARQDVTDADLVAYKDEHTPKPRATRSHPPKPVAR